MAGACSIYRTVSLNAPAGFRSDVARAPASATGVLDADATQTTSKHPKFRFPFAAAGCVFATVDALLIVASSILGCSVYGWFSSSVVANVNAFATAGSVAAILYMWMAHAAGFYRVS